MTTPHGWETRTLAEFIELQRGFDLPHRTRRAGLFKVLSSGEAHGWHDEPKVTGPGFVVGRATNIGRPTWSAEDFWPLNTTLFAKDFRGNDPKFAYYWFLGNDLSAYNSGSVQPMLNRNYIAQIPIDIPPLPEQRSIAATLSALDEKIESIRRASGKAEQLGDALFAAASDVSRRLSEVAAITMGSSPKGADLNEDGEGLPFYQGTRDFGVRFPSLRVWTTAPVRTAAKNDTLMSVRAPVGDLNRASADCCIGRGVAAIHSETHPSTLYYAMRSSSSAWHIFQGEGTVFASVNKTDVHGAEVRWINNDAISELEEELRAIDARIESLEREAQRLTSLRDALLPELLTGRVRVSAEGFAA